jgi:hypothetical protein
MGVTVERSMCDGTWLFEPGLTAAMFRARHMMVTYVQQGTRHIYN